MSSVGKGLPPSLQLSTLEGRSRTFKAHNTGQEATRRINNQQSPVFRVVAYRLMKADFIWWAMIDFEHSHKSNFLSVYTWGQVNLMMLALKSGLQIAAKVGNPAGLLCRRIWYSVVKSGVLGITEYRQGRPLKIVNPLVDNHPSFTTTPI